MHGGALLALLLACVALRGVWARRARRDTHATCLSADETDAILGADADGYVASLTRWDLKARGVRTTRDYARRISTAGRDFSGRERALLYRLARVADARFATLDIGPDIVALPWTFAKVGARYERGLAHTRRSVIFLPESALRESRDDILDTLIHEKVHVYQRTHPSETAAWVKAQGFTRWMRRADLAATGVRVRSNSDLDEWVYVNPGSRRPMLIDYDTETFDEAQAAMEHPYEYMAYGIAKMFR